MQNHLLDRTQIADLINGWMYRDLGEWDRLLELFHPDGVIEVTWFEGLFTEFVAASRRMAASPDVRNKHVIAPPSVTFDGDRAIAETNAIIVGENVSLGLGYAVHNRFYDMIEKRAGAWKIVKRQSIYDMGTFTFPRGIVAIDPDTVARYPQEYAPLGYILEKTGFPVRRVFATKGSDLERNMKAAGNAWLAG